MSDISFHCVTLNFSKVQGGGGNCWNFGLLCSCLINLPNVFEIPKLILIFFTVDLHCFVELKDLTVTAPLYTYMDTGECKSGGNPAISSIVTGGSWNTNTCSCFATETADNLDCWPDRDLLLETLDTVVLVPMFYVLIVFCLLFIRSYLLWHQWVQLHQWKVYLFIFGVQRKQWLLG